MSLLPERLQIARERRGFSQRELAKLCQLGINQINRYENGVTDPSATVLMSIAQTLGVSTDYLVGLVDDPKEQRYINELSPTEREMVETFRREGWSGVARLSVERLSK